MEIARREVAENTNNRDVYQVIYVNPLNIISIGEDSHYVDETGEDTEVCCSIKIGDSTYELVENIDYVIKIVSEAQSKLPTNYRRK